MGCKCADKQGCACNSFGKGSVVKPTSNGLNGRTSNPKSDTSKANNEPKEATKIPLEYSKMWKSPREK